MGNLSKSPCFRMTVTVKQDIWPGEQERIFSLCGWRADAGRASRAVQSGYRDPAPPPPPVDRAEGIHRAHDKGMLTRLRELVPGGADRLPGAGDLTADQAGVEPVAGE
jgi:hypothetical protein